MGRSTVLALAQEGVEVIASARGAERLHATPLPYRADGVRVTPVVADHSTERGARLDGSMPAPDISSPDRTTPAHPTLQDIREDDWVQSMSAVWWVRSS